MLKQNNLPSVITIDGPSSSGKGTISYLLAKRIGWHFLDSGALYRTLAWLAFQQGIDLVASEELIEIAANLHIKLIIDTKLKVIHQDQDITKLIRSEKCSSGASMVAVIPEIREALIPVQRKFRQEPGLVTDGRDMGTVVFPDAKLKIFLTASLEERAKRRFQQLQEQGIHVTLHDVSTQMMERDLRDEKREVAPLLQAAGARFIDTTKLGIDEVLEQLVTLIEQVF
jgi:cytidylate kinase